MRARTARGDAHSAIPSAIHDAIPTSKEKFMEFAVEAISPTRKKVALSLTAEDVNAAIARIVAEYRKDLTLPGFRKGKVPASVVERRFGDEIRSRATSEAVNDSLRQALEAEALSPLSRPEADNTALFEKNAPFSCSLQFDVLPAIDFPPYEGLDAEEDGCEVADDEVDEIIERLRGSMAEQKDMTKSRTPRDGDVVDVDYAGFEPDDPSKPVDDVKGEHFSIVLGEKQALDDFEALVKTALVGEEKEGVVSFPEAYGHASLAGKKVLFRIRLNAIRERILPEVDEAFAKKTGHDDLEKLRAAIVEHVRNEKKQAARSTSMRALLDSLLSRVTFDIPESMLQSRIERVLGDRRIRLERMGKSLDELGKSEEELREEARAEALESLRPQIFLMALAQREKLSVTEQEVEIAIYTMSMRAGQEYKQVRDAYYRSGLVHELRDRLLADKAMEFIYAKANVKQTGAPDIAPDAATAESAEKAE